METETTASKINGLLEDVYETLRVDTPDLPKVFFKLDHGRTLRAQVWGHFAPEVWTADGEPRHEIMIASECLAAGAFQVLQTVIHEAVHALAEARGIRETSRQGRYHNRKFVTLAEELGMTYDAPKNRNALGKLVPDDRIGYSSVVLTEATLEKYADLLTWLQAEITAYRGSGKFVSAPAKRVTHAYVVFANEFSGGANVIQMGTTKYAKISQYLSAHTVIISEATQADLEGWIEDALNRPTQEEGFSWRKSDDYCGDHHMVFPEFLALDEEG